MCRRCIERSFCLQVTLYHPVCVLLKLSQFLLIAVRFDRQCAETFSFQSVSQVKEKEINKTNSVHVLWLNRTHKYCFVCLVEEHAALALERGYCEHVSCSQLRYCLLISSHPRASTHCSTMGLANGSG